MIEREIEITRRELADEDIFKDSLTTFRDRIGRHGYAENDVGLMHAVHQLVLVASFMNDAFYDELRDRAVARLREFGHDEEEEPSEDDLPIELRLVVRELNRGSLKSLFDTDYGTVRQSEVAKRVAQALDLGPDSESEQLQQLSGLLRSVLQKEFDALDEEYRDELDALYDEIEREIRDGDEVDATLAVLKEHNVRWHSRVKGWPRLEE